MSRRRLKVPTLPDSGSRLRSSPSHPPCSVPKGAPASRGTALGPNSIHCPTRHGASTVTSHGRARRQTSHGARDGRASQGEAKAVARPATIQVDCWLRCLGQAGRAAQVPASTLVPRSPSYHPSPKRIDRSAGNCSIPTPPGHCASGGAMRTALTRSRGGSAGGWGRSAAPGNHSGDATSLLFFFTLGASESEP